MKLLWFVFLFSSFAFAVDPYKIKPIGYEPVCDKSNIELKNLPPLRDQGRYGLCYAHSSLLLLEHLRCSNSPDPSSCYDKQGSVLHLARFNHTRSEERIDIGGNPISVLSRFLDTKKLAPEKCAEYDDWKKLDQYQKEERKKLTLPDSERDEADYFYYISRRLKQNASFEEKSCWANELVEAGINQNIQDIMKVLNEGKGLEWQELRYQLLVPKSCLKEATSYPDYTLHTFPKYNEKKSFKGFRDFIFRSLSAGVPVEASFKASFDGYHSATIVGQRHVCDKLKCELQFKIQNSYGKSWQDIYDDGWVNAENLTELMEHQSMGVSAILPKGKSLSMSVSAPYYENSPVRSNGSFSSSRKCWEVREGSQEFITDDRGKRPPPVTTNPESRGERGVWSCSKDGKKYFGEYALQGWDCKKMQ
ncbi:MAG: hypothetical protein ACLGHN_01000 [Bacteriovoracia bacterium]